VGVGTTVRVRLPRRILPSDAEAEPAPVALRTTM
jgi:hypothetical protein